MFAQIVADELGVPIERVEVTTGDTRRFGYAVGTFASRAAVMSGNAVALAARKVRAKALRIAAEALEADPRRPGDRRRARAGQGQPGRVDRAGDGRGAVQPAAVRVRRGGEAGDPVRVGARRLDEPPVADDEEPGLEGTDYYSPPRSTFANGMHAVVVETDPDTAEIKILRYCVVHDCGTLINPMIVEGQVHGGVAQGVGGALYERMAYDEHGPAAQRLVHGLPDAVRHARCRTIEIDHLETPSPLNPLGIKGAGEAGVIPGAAVIAAAIEDAEGFPITRMPISPSELFELRAARR